VGGSGEERQNDRKKASEFESAARGAAGQQAKLGERPPYLWSEARKRWLSETRKRSKSKDELILTWFELPPHLSLAAQFAVLTDLRMRSMLTLTWDRVDMKAATAWIPAEQMKAGVALGVPLSPDAIQVLKDLRERSPDGDAVFQYEGVQLGDANGAAFKKAVKRAKVGHLRWHDLRHTWASWAVQSGATLHEVMQLGGWASYSMVLRYAHLGPKHLAAAAARVSFEKAPHDSRHSDKVDEKGAAKSLIYTGKGGTRTLDPGIMSAVL
jgi:integrase